MIMMRYKYLERSQGSYSCIPLVVTYLIVAVIFSGVVVGVSLVNEPTVEIVNGLLSATHIPGLDLSATTDMSQCRGWFGSGFIGFVRLIPVLGHPEREIKAPSEVYSLGTEDQDGYMPPASYCLIFNESDLMSRLHMGTLYYTIY